MSYDVVQVTTEGVTLSGLVFARYRQPTKKVVEGVLDATPGLAALGPFLPIGTLVRFPVSSTDTGATTAAEGGVALW